MKSPQACRNRSVWVIAVGVGALLAGVAVQVPAAQPYDSLVWVSRWGPWLVAFLLAGASIGLAAFGRVASRGLACFCGVYAHPIEVKRLETLINPTLLPHPTPDPTQSQNASTYIIILNTVIPSLACEQSGQNHTGRQGAGIAAHLEAPVPYGLVASSRARHFANLTR